MSGRVKKILQFTVPQGMLGFFHNRRAGFCRQVPLSRVPLGLLKSVITVFLPVAYLYPRPPLLIKTDAMQLSGPPSRSVGEWT